MSLRVNSFTAAAYLASRPGNGALPADYNKAHNTAYQNYDPKKRCEIYGSQWTVSSLDG